MFENLEGWIKFSENMNFAQEVKASEHKSIT